MTKPICFSYKDYTDLRDAYKQLLEDCNVLTADNRKMRKKIAHQAQRVNELLEENTNLRIDADAIPRYKRIIDSQHETIATYRNIFLMHEATIKKLREEQHNETD